MLPASGPPADESPEARFRQVLADVRRAAGRRTGEAGEDAAAYSSINPFASTVFPANDSRLRATGGASHWHAALDWLEEQDGPAALVESPPVADEGAEAILAELGLTADLTDRELSRMRRLYMWRHHPDRHRESQRASATCGWLSPTCCWIAPDRV